MIDLPTPETDAVAEKNIYGVACKVDVDFARKLERERDEAIESSEAWSALAWKLEGERNEQMKKLHSVLEILNNYNQHIKNPRRAFWDALKKMFTWEALS